MKTIHFCVVVRKEDVRVICWTRLFAFSILGGIAFGGTFEYLRYMVEGTWSLASILREVGMLGCGIGVVLLVDGLMKPIENLDPFVHLRDDDPDIIEAIEHEKLLHIGEAPPEKPQNQDGK